MQRVSSFNRVLFSLPKKAANLGIFGHGFEGLYSTSCTSEVETKGTVMWETLEGNDGKLPHFP